VSRDLMQRRGGIQPGSAPQETCDVCELPLKPEEAHELTYTRPPRHVPGIEVVRLYAHRACARDLPDLLPPP
jgi:hypothetical protein